MTQLTEIRVFACVVIVAVLSVHLGEQCDKPSAPSAAVAEGDRFAAAPPGPGDWGSSSDVRDVQHRSDLCSACQATFDFVDTQLAIPRGCADVLLMAEILDANPCRSAAASVQGTCLAVLEDIDRSGALRAYVSQRSPSVEQRVLHCSRWCSSSF